MTQEQSKTEWWEDFFDDTFADLMLDRGDEEEPARTGDFLFDKLGLKKGDTVFDQCCGIGDMSHMLARRGCRAIGVDIIPSYTERARKTAEADGLDCAFHTGDGFKFLPDEPCDAAINWWTSFGYSDDDELNIEMFRRAFESLKPGAAFALDYMNTPWLMRNYGKRRERAVKTDTGTWLVTRETKLDLERGMIIHKFIYIDPHGERREKQGGGAKLYMPHELARMLRNTGFTDIAFYGDLDASALTLDSTRCIAVARKPGGGA